MTTSLGELEGLKPYPLPPADSGKNAYLVLLGCSILQLPIWGFAMSYGVLQEYYSSSVEFHKISSSTGVIGTTLTGIIYCSMPFLFAAFTERYARFRRISSIIGIMISVSSLVLSAFSNSVWQLVMTQGILQAIGSTVLYSATTIYIDEWFPRRKGFAYGVMLSAKSAFGVVAPLVFGDMFSSIGFANTLLIWAAVVATTALPCVFLLKPRKRPSTQRRISRALSWKFLNHPTFYIFQISNIIFSMGYTIPQTYLSSYSTNILHVSTARSSLMLALLNAPSIIASSWFGVLSDGTPYYHGHSMNVGTVTVICALGSCLPIFFLWGLSSSQSAGVALLTVFSIVYGFFAGGYSATWGGVVKEIEKEGIAAQEAVNTSVLFGLMNGGRGVGYVIGGFAGSELLKAGSVGHSHEFAYATRFGSLIVLFGCICCTRWMGCCWEGCE